MRSLSIVLPARDEEATIAIAVRSAIFELDRRGIAGEVIVVDDGSVDRTAACVAQIGDRRVRAISQPPAGYGAALLRGIRASRFEHIFFTDADLQFDIRELSRLEANSDAHDIVIGYREVRADPVHRRMNGWAWNLAVNAAFGLRVRDVDCAFKLFRRRVFDTIGAPISGGAFVNAEVLALALRAGFALSEVPVSHLPRRAGRPSGADPGVISRAWIDFGRFYAASLPGRPKAVRRDIQREVMLP